MNTKFDSKIPKCGDLPDLRKNQIIVGTKQLRKALQKGNVRFVFLAENADPAITEPIETACKVNHISYAWIRTMQELGRACGIDVGAAAAAAID